MNGAILARKLLEDKLAYFGCGSKQKGSELRPASKLDGISNEIGEKANGNKGSIIDCEPLEIDGNGNFVDGDGRKIILKGINVDSAMKLPVSPKTTSYTGNADDPNDEFYDGDNVSFVGRPFPLSEAREHFERIKSWGYNTIRYLITWEALEHEGPGIYDEAFVDYTVKVLSIIYEIGGLYVFIETHQDVWSRYSGGSGAPMWTFYAAGLDPRKFVATEAAILHNESRFKEPEPKEQYSKMLWTSNYKRLASLVMFTLFFSGKNYFPKCVINGENIQDILQGHYFRALSFFWQKVSKALPHMISNGSLMGFELLNEPNKGLMGQEDLGVLPAEQHLRVGTTPTAYQCMKLGMGIACNVLEYKITITGPQKQGVKVVDPKGVRAWLSPSDAAMYDRKYGWQRGDLWTPGVCIFALHEIWTWDKGFDFDSLSNLSEFKRLEFSREKCHLLKPNYFRKVSPSHNFTEAGGTDLDVHYFINHNFLDFYKTFKDLIRNVTPNVFIMMQPPVLEVPPDLRVDPRHIVDSKTVYCPHYYDGLSLMFKTWNTKYNVDTLGIMRGKYYNPVLGLVIGERAIRSCLQKQFVEIRNECEKYLGKLPVLMSETGMPFDMDDKKAYECGRYTAQTAALDALSSALEALSMSHTYWCYTSINSHQWGDSWNNEDFSFWSPDDRNNNFIEEAYSSTSMSGSSSRRSLISSLKSTIIASAKSGDISNVRTAIRDNVKNLGLQKVKLARQGRQNDMQTTTINESEESSGSSKESLQLNTNTNPNSNTLSEAPKFKYPFEKQNSVAIESETIQSGSTGTSCNGINLKRFYKRCFPSADGVRAPSAVIRPFLVATIGEIVTSEFDLNSVKYTLTIKLKEPKYNKESRPTIIYVPKWHYPKLTCQDITLSHGIVKYNEMLEYIEWHHTEDDSSVSQNRLCSRDRQETIVIKAEGTSNS